MIARFLLAATLLLSLFARAEEPDPTKQDFSKYPNPFVVKKWSFDLGGAAMPVGNETRMEYSLAANAYFYRFLTWRNALFTQQGTTSAIGLDTTEIFTYVPVKGFIVFAGPGFRFVNPGTNSLFGEAGLGFRVAGLALTCGARVIVNSWMKTSEPNQTQYFGRLEIGAPR